MRFPKLGVISAVFIIFLLGTAVVAQTAAVSADLPNFSKVNDRLYRGGQPKDAGFAELKKWASQP